MCSELTAFSTLRAISRLTRQPMTESTPSAPQRPRLAEAAVFVATFTGLLVAIAVMLALDLFLARIDRAASAARAADEYADGRRALMAGRPSEAADRFATAASIERRNVDYALGLGEAMLEDGRTAD